MDALKSILESSSLETVWSTLNQLAAQQQTEASKGLKLFICPPAKLYEGEMSKEKFIAMTKEERLVWQRSKEEERRQLNAVAGIDGAALLTKENVEAWRQQGMTFAAMARDILGVPQEKVSAILKSHNRTHPIQAAQSKKKTP